MNIKQKILTVFLLFFFFIRTLLRLIVDNIPIIISVLYAGLLIYNLFASQFKEAAISLGVFLVTGSASLKKTKEKHPGFVKMIRVVGCIPLIFLGIAVFDALNGFNPYIPPEERQYIDSVLSHVTAETTKAESIELLGTPSRDLLVRVNWWVSIAGRKSRIGISFSGDTGLAEEIVLDGGPGRFYYTKDLTENIRQIQ